jgi:hypothetical protein
MPVPFPESLPCFRWKPHQANTTSAILPENDGSRVGENALLGGVILGGYVLMGFYSLRSLGWGVPLAVVTVALGLPVWNLLIMLLSNLVGAVFQVKSPAWAWWSQRFSLAACWGTCCLAQPLCPQIALGLKLLLTVILGVNGLFWGVIKFRTSR